jgi:hypothetical protein
MKFDIEKSLQPNGQMAVVIHTNNVDVVWAVGSPEGVQPAFEEAEHLARLVAVFHGPLSVHDRRDLIPD